MLKRMKRNETAIQPSYAIASLYVAHYCFLLSYLLAPQIKRALAVERLMDGFLLFSFLVSLIAAVQSLIIGSGRKKEKDSASNNEIDGGIREGDERFLSSFFCHQQLFSFYIMY